MIEKFSAIVGLGGGMGSTEGLSGSVDQLMPWLRVK